MTNLTTRLAAATLGLMLLAPAVYSADVPPGQKPATQPADKEAAVKKISLKEFDAMRADKNNVVLDVRTPKEFAAGHVPGAINIDWHARDFNDQVSKLDKGKTYVLHCQAGVRSAAAAKRMSEMDFPHLYDFSGGFSTYDKAKEPVAK